MRPPRTSLKGDPDRVRARLHRSLSRFVLQTSCLGTLRALGFTAVSFQQMSLQWLPEDEGVQLRLEFETEMEWLQSAAYDQYRLDPLSGARWA